MRLPVPVKRPTASPLGRRLLLMMAAATLAPIALLTLLTNLQVTGSLAEQQDSLLAQQAKAHGIAVFERLSHVDDVLQAVVPDLHEGVTLVQLHAKLLQRHSDELTAIARLDRDGRTLEAVGEVPPLQARLAALTPDQRARVDAGTVLLLAPLLDEPEQVKQPLVMLTALPAPAAPSGQAARYLAAALDPAYVWGDADLWPPLTTHCVVTAGQAKLHCPAPVPDTLPVEEAERGERTRHSWTARGATQRAGAWSLFVGSRFVTDHGENWTVFAVQPADYALSPIRDFRKAFVPLALLCLVGMLLLAMRQARRISAPIEELVQATQRLSQRDFGAQVTLDGDDEFGRLGQAFNTMARRLALQFGTLQAMARIDRAILNSVDLSEVAVNSIRCLRHIVDTDLISVGLIHPESPTRLMVQTRRRGARGIESIEIDWPDVARASAAAVPALPPEYERHLAAGAQAGTTPPLRVLPISRAGSFWGVVVLGDAPRGRQIDPDQAALLSGVVDRLAVALSTAARDWRLHVQAHYDPLTGLPNRMNLLTLLTQHIAAARRAQSRGAVLFLDLDRFKQTNDTLGHAAGDQLLRLAAERIRLSLREADSVARIGGDEFTVVLPQIAASRDASQVAANLIAALARPFEVEGQKIYAGGSVGIALFPDDGHTAEDLLKRADTAMYRAKELGRGRFAFFKESMGLEVSARATLDRELRQALERREFVLHYQPQVELASGAIVCAEALLRWQHPTRGLIGPGEFIEFAEESGLIEAIGAWVLREACRQHQQWEAAGLTLPRVAVNVSNRQLRQPGFLMAVDMALVKARRVAAQLEVEITESMVLDGGDSAQRTLAGLKDAGVAVAIDDFGTGYSSFGYLRTLPSQVLKLDRTFVIDIARDADADVIAGSMIGMARTLRKTVVVEGVETSEQLARLARHGAHCIQGYLVSRPLPAEAFERFVRAYRPELFAQKRRETDELAAE